MSWFQINPLLMLLKFCGLHCKRRPFYSNFYWIEWIFYFKKNEECGRRNPVWNEVAHGISSNLKIIYYRYFDYVYKIIDLLGFRKKHFVPSKLLHFSSSLSPNFFFIFYHLSFVFVHWSFLSIFFSFCNRFVLRIWFCYCLSVKY